MTSLGRTPSNFHMLVLWLPMERERGEMGEVRGKGALVVSKIFYFLIKKGREVNPKHNKGW